MFTNRTVLFVAHLRRSGITNTVFSTIFGDGGSAKTFASLDSSATGNSADVPG